MAGEGSFLDFSLLSKLLSTPQAPVTSASKAPSAANLKPSDIFAPTSGGAKGVTAAAPVAASSGVSAGGCAGAASPALGAAKPSSDIWGAEEIDDVDEEEAADPRKRPTYDVVYKQSVGAEDLYLGLSGKTPLSSDCNVMVVKVHLPGAKLPEIELDVNDNKIVVSSKEFKLSTFLPHPVPNKSGSASWDQTKCILAVTFHIQRPEL